MRVRYLAALLALALLLAIPVLADISGTWTATFDTEIGQQTYT
jgi:hypothetical protein